MKTTLAAFFLLLLTAAGCSHKEDSVAPASAAGATFPEIIASGNWVVTSCTQGTEDKTNSMSGIRFTFDKNGQATAVQGSDLTPGGWAWGGNSYYGTPASSKTVTFAFGARKPFDKISRPWIIQEATAAVMKLDSSNPAEAEHLVFSR